jgi:hypothetical protein
VFAFTIRYLLDRRLGDPKAGMDVIMKRKESVVAGNRIMFVQFIADHFK